MLNKTVKDWAEDDQPREKLLNKGKASLSNAELLAILLRTGTKQYNVLDLARMVLESVNNNLIELGKLQINEFTKFKGMGQVKAITLVAALELGRRRRESEILEKKKISSSKDIFEFMCPKIGDLPHEEFWLITLNRANKIISTHRIGTGGISSTIADVRIILKIAIEQQASSIIICHNHPSGQLQPSMNDKTLTKKVKDAAAIIDIDVLDHLIVTDTAYYSFADEGVL